MAAPFKTAAAGFVPRTTFEVSPSITRSYFLGHHAGALTSMRKVLSNIGLILECRDGRVPLTSANPLLESSLAGRDRIIVYTKADLCAPASANRWVEKQQRLLSEWHSSQHHHMISAEDEGEGEGEGEGENEGEYGDGDRIGRRERERGGRGGSGSGSGSGFGNGRTNVIFTDERNPRSIARLLDAVKERARASDSLIGLRALVVGMPNAGKSTLLNALRREGMRLPKAARTGAQPGVTRKLASPVRIVASEDSSHSSSSSSSSSPSSSSGYYRNNNNHNNNYNHFNNNNNNNEGVGEGIFVVDTPGVFVPYVSDIEAMLKLSLVGCVKDGLVPAETIADYLLFRMNLRDPGLYAHLAAPTNDALGFLEAVARRTGKLLRGGEPALDHAADWVVQQWRKGNLGRFPLDDVSEDGLRAWRERRRASVAGGSDGGEEPISMNQARKRVKEARKTRNAAKRSAAAEGP